MASASLTAAKMAFPDRLSAWKVWLAREQWQLTARLSEYGDFDRYEKRCEVCRTWGGGAKKLAAHLKSPEHASVISGISTELILIADALIAETAGAPLDLDTWPKMAIALGFIPDHIENARTLTPVKFIISLCEIIFAIGTVKVHKSVGMDMGRIFEIMESGGLPEPQSDVEIEEFLEWVTANRHKLKNEFVTEFYKQDWLRDTALADELFLEFIERQKYADENQLTLFNYEFHAFLNRETYWNGAGWSARVGARFAKIANTHRRFADMIEQSGAYGEVLDIFAEDDAVLLSDWLGRGVVAVEPRDKDLTSLWSFNVFTQAVFWKATECVKLLCDRLPLSSIPWNIVFNANIEEFLNILQTATHSLHKKHGPVVFDYIKPCMSSEAHNFEFPNLLVLIEADEIKANTRDPAMPVKAARTSRKIGL